MQDIDEQIHAVTNELSALLGEQQKIAHEIAQIELKITSKPEEAADVNELLAALKLRRDSIPSSLKEAQRRRRILVASKGK
jgi:chromosome segregation ATPase